VLFAYLDASALAKRYIPEIGTNEINHLFARIPLDRMIVLNVGLAEVVSLLVRKRNAGRLPIGAFQQALADFAAEIASPVFPIKIAADDRLVASAYVMIERHSVNGNDGILLQSAFDLVAEFRPLGHDLVLVASDKRLINAAHREGISAFDPELQTIAELDALVGP